MIRPGFLDDIARNGLAEHRVVRRANALVLLDRRLRCIAVAEVLLLDDDTVRSWYTLYQQAAFIAAYEALLKDMQADDVALFGDAVPLRHCTK